MDEFGLQIRPLHPILFTQVIGDDAVLRENHCLYYLFAWHKLTKNIGRSPGYLNVSDKVASSPAYSPNLSRRKFQRCGNGYS